MTVRLIGIDPGLCHTGWGIIDEEGSKLTPVAHGIIHTQPKDSIGLRLKHLFQELEKVIKTFSPQEAAIEEIFVNKNPGSTLKLGMARGVAFMVPTLFDMPVSEYSPNTIKKAVVGSGHAQKNQIETMVAFLLKGTTPEKDAADALAVALCHAHHRNLKRYDRQALR